MAASEANDELEETLAAMKLADLEIDDSRCIGKGAYGFVYLATHRPTGIQVAVKKLDKELLKKKTLALLLKSEIEIHKRLKHDNIVRLYADLQDAKYMYLVMEYVPKNNLYKEIKKAKCLKEEDAFFFFI